MVEFGPSVLYLFGPSVINSFLPFAIYSVLQIWSTGLRDSKGEGVNLVNGWS